MLLRIIFALLFFTSMNAQAETYKFCFEDWEPYASVDKSGKPFGTTVDIVQEALKQLGHEAQFELIEVSQRCTAMVKEGQKDGFFFATMDSEDESSKFPKVKTSTEYWILSAIVPEDSPLQKFTNLAEFKGKTFGTVTGYEYNDEINNEKKNWKIDEAPIAAQNMKKLSAKRIDFTIDDPAWALIEMKKKQFEVPYFDA